MLRFLVGNLVPHRKTQPLLHNINAGFASRSSLKRNTMMSISSMFGSAFRTLNRASEVAQKLHIIDWLLGFMTGGKEVPPDAANAAKGWFGMLFSGDERAFEVLLSQLEHLRPGGRALIADYMAWAFPFNGTLKTWVASTIYRNRFRVFILNQGGSKGEKVGDETRRETWVTPKTKHKVTKSQTRGIYSSGSNNSLGFLVYMVDFITEKGGREPGFEAFAKEGEKVLNFVPRIPKSYDKILDDVENFLNEIKAEMMVAPSAFRAAGRAGSRKARKLRNHVRDQQKFRRNPIMWLLRKLAPFGKE